MDFFSKFQIMQWNGFTTKNKQWFFKLVSVRSVKTACVCTVFFFRYFKYYGQNILFQEHWCLT